MRDATAIAEAVRSGEVSAVELTREHLARAEADQLGAVWLVSEGRALEEAAAVDAALAAGQDAGPLAGVPVGWKDLIDTGGIRTTYGSAIYRDHVPGRDAEVVARLAAAGAICIGKLATHELAWGTTSDNPHFGTCRNPHDPTRMPGGSSGGSGAAVAAGIVALAPGTDTGGSIRCPASVCGIVGLKPTFGRVSLAGIHPLCPSLDHCGPMARSVRDCALALELMAGASPRDPRTPAVPAERYRDALGRGVAGMTVGVAERYFFEHTDPELTAIVRAAVQALADAGARLVEIDMHWPVADAGPASFYLAEEMGVMAPHWPARSADMGRDVVSELERGDRLLLRDAGQAQLARLGYQERMLEQLSAEGVDLVVSPTQPCPPPVIGTRRVPFAGNPEEDVTSVMCGLTDVFNVLGWPAITVPCGSDSLGLPVGCQIAAAPWRESDCLAAAEVVEAAGLF
ncbi:MAG: aspartyl-tRNA(Asn)/glutamyl-tRNA(Gln) amidotransferase subunit [Gaiellales bacterium]|nr:aspartyl-tRNA(Asn)/glutamyl-tRNA(Gln) amidotransferase subunit [Gaiellales bacterium]